MEDFDKLEKTITAGEMHKRGELLKSIRKGIDGFCEELRDFAYDLSSEKKDLMEFNIQSLKNLIEGYQLKYERERTKFMTEVESEVDIQKELTPLYSFSELLSPGNPMKVHVNAFLGEREHVFHCTVADKRYVVELSPRIKSEDV